MKSISKNLSVQPYGSWVVRINIQESDIDLCLIDSSETKETSFEIFKSFEAILEGEDWVESYKNIYSAKVPVFKIETKGKFEKMKVDITLKNSVHAGITSVCLVESYLKLYKPLKPMILVLKRLLYILQLEDPYLGGLTSYGLLLMIVAFIQVYHYCHISLIFMDLILKIWNRLFWESY